MFFVERSILFEITINLKNQTFKINQIIVELFWSVPEIDQLANVQDSNVSLMVH